MVMILIPLISLLITLVLWFIYGKNKKLDIKEEIYPPKINIFEAMYIFRKKFCGDALGLMIIELCNKGYIKIIEKETYTLFNKASELEIVKVKDYMGNDYNEKIFMDNLFKNLNTINYYNALNIISKIKSKIKYKEIEAKMFCETPSWIYWLIILLIIVTYFTITYIPISVYGDISSLIVALLFPSIGFTVLFYSIGSREPIDVNFGSNKRRRLSAIIFGCVFGLLMCAFPLYMFIPLLKGNYLFFYIIGLVCVFIMIFISDRFTKRTDLGNELISKLLGFKLHLKNTIINDSDYFYEVLPYIYIFNLQNRYLNMKIDKPRWYESSSFDMKKLNQLIVSIISAAMNVLPKDIE